MSYTNNPREPARDEWYKIKPTYKTDKTSDEIRNEGSSKRYGTGGRWIDKFTYIAINGSRSHGAVPAKLRTSDEDIPISPSDITYLTKRGLIEKM